MSGQLNLCDARQVVQASSLLVLFIALAYRLSEQAGGSGESDPESFRLQLSEILTAPQPVPEVFPSYTHSPKWVLYPSQPLGRGCSTQP